MAVESSIAIGDKIFGIPMMYKYVVTVKASHIGGGGFGEGRNEIDHFCESIDHHKNCVVPLLGRGEMDDEIHADALPRLVRDGQRLELSAWFLIGVFVCLARGALAPRT